jgi:DNA-binding CsgD family transcriptional regulator
MATPRGPNPSIPALVGREREQAALREALAGALAGRGTLVLIGGKAGIGKTALVEALLPEAQEQGALVLVGRCYDLAETPPYGPWAEALAPYPADLPPPPATLTRAGQGVAVASQAALFQQVREALAALAARRPLLLFLDDLHWADPASLDLLRHLARGLAALPVLLLATYRADELTRHHPLYTLLPRLVREAHADRLDLRPLGDDDVRALVGGRYPLLPADGVRMVAHLQAHAEGNPFYLGELVRALEEGGLLRPAAEGWALGDLALVRVPPFLQQVVEGRLARLGEGVRGLLDVAAVIGQEVPLALWRTVSGAEEDTLLHVVEHAVAAHLLAETADGGGVRFTHALIREALYEGLLTRRRRDWHRRAAEALIAAPQSDPDAVAHHFHQAGDVRTIAWLFRAGERAWRTWAWASAADRYEAALALLPEEKGEAERRDWLLLRLAALRRHADPDRGVAYLDEADRLATATADAPLAALTGFVRGHLHGLAGDPARAVAEVAAGVAALEALETDGNARLSTLAEAVGLARGGERGTLANWLVAVGRFAEARAMGERVLAEVPAPAMTGRSMIPYLDAYLAMVSACALLGDPGAARHALGRAHDLYRAIGHHFNLGVLARIGLRYVALPYYTDDLSWRCQLADEIVAADRRGDGVIPNDYPQRAHTLPLLLLEGHWDEAEALGRTVDPATHRGLYRDVIAPGLGELAQVRGELAISWQFIRTALPVGTDTRPESVYWVGSLALHYLAVTLATEAADFPAARIWLAAADRWLAWSSAVHGRAEGALAHAAYYRAAGDLEQARQHAQAALAHATAPRQPLALLAAHRTLGEVDTAAGRHTEAMVHLDAAHALADACAAPYERALTLLALAELRLARADKAGAHAALAEARALLEPLDARPALARAAALSARLDAARPNGLSRREVEVLRLLATGRSNRTIAAALYLSPGTVQRHVANAYLKIGAHNRAEATAYALRHRLA